MRKVILQFVKATFPVLAVCSTVISTAFSQQHIIANKDNTRPEINQQYTDAVKLTSFTATQFNGYNEIQFSALSGQDNRKFIVEYSVDGYNYQSAGEVLPANNSYALKHYTPDKRPMLYRLRSEAINGKSYTSNTILLDGTAIAPVSIYPTVINGDMVNVNTSFPVERASIVSTDGTQVLAKDFNGATGYLRLPVPSLSQGTYLVTFYGNGWQSTSKFIASR